MLNIGLISKWHVHAPGYAKQLKEDPRVRIAAVWDEDPERGAQWARELGAAFIADYGEFLAGDIQAVVCDSPTAMHAELLTGAANAGKHIFTEKLLAPTVKEAEQIAGAVRKNGVTFTISLPCKGDRAVLYVKRLIEEGKLGRVTAARFRRSHNGVDWLPKYWFDTAQSGGGALMDLGAHPVYVLGGLFGAPKRVTALMAELFGTGSDENTVALAEFEGGILATMETAFVTQGVPDLLEVYGTGGAVYVRGGEVARNIGDGMEAVPPEDLPEGMPNPLSRFIQACLDGVAEPEGLGLEDGILMTRITEAAYEADRSGRTVTI
ncbi:MAG: Gfo/Idh/MocA family oxidoreductase [Oscillospiraceae bacterium]|jgi:predicted dehydrogenase|nr:Gfo/Idh/MocA family oxidoreductase [Oscillospiraceae bacterium]